MASAALVYKVEDRSLLLPFYRRFFVDPVLPHLPATLNPNTITHAGHLANLFGTVVLIYLWPKAGWPFITAAALLQFYLWCDNADGAHARRTNQCSAFGELLDHGLDALNTVYIAYLTAMALGLPPIWWVVIALIIPGAGAMTYWEQTQTGMFHLGLLNQIESLTVLATTLIISAIFGSSFWADTHVFGISLQHAMLAWATSTIVFGMLRNVQRVAARDGFASVFPALAFLGLGITILLAAKVGAISTVTAVALATGGNVFFATRMLSLRLRGMRPRVEPVQLAFTALLVSVIAWVLLGHRSDPLTGAAVAAIVCAIFAAQSVQEARASILHLERLPAR